MTKPSKYRVEIWRNNEWCRHSWHKNEMPAVANFEVLVTAGEKARIIFQGKIIKEG